MTLTPILLSHSQTTRKYCLSPFYKQKHTLFEKISRKLRQNTVLFTIFVTVTNIHKVYVD